MSTTVEQSDRRIAVGAAMRAAGGAAVAALVLNFADRLVAGALGADFRVQVGDATQTIGFGMVAFMTLGPMVLGALALVLASRWGRRGWDAVGWLGLVVGVVTVVLPLSADAGTGTRLALALMHVVAGVTWLVAVRRLPPRG